MPLVRAGTKIVSSKGLRNSMVLQGDMSHPKFFVQTAQVALFAR
jgi:hypothetical protein